MNKKENRMAVRQAAQQDAVVLLVTDHSLLCCLTNSHTIFFLIH